MAGELSSFGLTMATIASVGNVCNELTRKVAVAKHNVMAVTLSYRIVTCLFMTIVVVVLARYGFPPKIVDSGQLFGATFLHLSPTATFVAYIAILTSMLGYSTWLNLRALQLSPISTVVPMLSFTPAFLILTGWIGFGELPTPQKLIGIVLIVAGAFAIHVDLLSEGPLAPLQAIFRERGSRYMLGVALIFAVTNPIEKRIVLMSGPFTEALAYAIGSVFLFSLLCFAFRQSPRPVIRDVPGFILLIAVFDTIVQISQFAAQSALPVAVAVSIKRSGIILIVLFGWLLFKESNVRQKLLGCGIMVIGICEIYLSMGLNESVVLALVGLAILLPIAILLRNPRPPLSVPS